MRRLRRLDRGDRARASEASSCELLARLESEALRHGHSPAHAHAATRRHRTVQQHEHAERCHAARGALCDAQVDADPNADAIADANARSRSRICFLELELERSPGHDVKRARWTPRWGGRGLDRGRGQGRGHGAGKFSVRRGRIKQYEHHERDLPAPSIQCSAPDVRATLTTGRSAAGGEGAGLCDTFAPARPATSRFEIFVFAKLQIYIHYITITTLHLITSNFKL